MCRALTIRKQDAPSRTRTRESDRRQVYARLKGGAGFFLAKQAKSGPRVRRQEGGRRRQHTVGS